MRCSYKEVKMTTIWLTYAWADNETGDVDYAAQELAQVGLDVKLDRWNLQAGERLWPQIEAFIQDPARSDAWALYATQNSLGSSYAIEVRPRAGTWSPFFAGVPAREKDTVQSSLGYGPRGNPANVTGMLFGSGEGASTDGEWWLTYAQSECTPTQSYYVFCVELPSKLAFGVRTGPPQYLVDIRL